MAYLILFDSESQEQLKDTLLFQQEAQILALGELEPNQETIIRYMKNEDLMQTISVVFRAECSTCHGNEGDGLAGPNLCDDTYVLVKKLPDIFEVISKGSISKGMLPFSGSLSKTKIVLLSAYVANLRNSVPSGKYAEGTSIPPWTN